MFLFHTWQTKSAVISHYEKCSCFRSNQQSSQFIIFFILHLISSNLMVWLISFYAWSAAILKYRENIFEANAKKIFRVVFFVWFCFSGLGMESPLGLRLESSIPNIGTIFFSEKYKNFFQGNFFCFLGLGARKFKFLSWKNSHLSAIDVAMMEFFLNFCKYFKWTFYDTITIVSVSKHGLGTLLGLIEVKRLALDSSANP